MSGQVIRDVIIKVSLQNKSDTFGLPPDWRTKIDEAANYIEKRFGSIANRVNFPLPGSGVPTPWVNPSTPGQSTPQANANVHQATQMRGQESDALRRLEDRQAAVTAAREKDLSVMKDLMATAERMNRTSSTVGLAALLDEDHDANSSTQRRLKRGARERDRVGPDGGKVIIPDDLQDINAGIIRLQNKAEHLVKEERAVNALMEARKRDNLTLKDSIGRGKEMVDVALQLTRGYALLGASLGVDTEKWLKYAAAAQGSMDILEGIGGLIGKTPGGPVVGGAVAVGAGALMYAQANTAYQRNRPKDVYSRWDGEKFTANEYAPQNQTSLAWDATKSGAKSLSRWVGHRMVEIDDMTGGWAGMLAPPLGFAGQAWKSDYQDSERYRKHLSAMSSQMEFRSKSYENSGRFYQHQNRLQGNELDFIQRGWDMGTVTTRRNPDGSFATFNPYEYQDRVSQVEQSFADRNAKLTKFRADRDKGGDPGVETRQLDAKADLENQAEKERMILEIRKQGLQALEEEKRRIYENVEAMSKLVKMEKSRQDSEKRQFGHLHPAEQERALGIAKRLKEGKQVAPWEHEFLEKIGRGDNKFTEGFFRERGKKSDELDELLGRDNVKKAEEARDKAVQDKNNAVPGIDDEITKLKGELEAGNSTLKSLLDLILETDRMQVDIVKAVTDQVKKLKQEVEKNGMSQKQNAGV